MMGAHIFLGVITLLQISCCASAHQLIRAQPGPPTMSPMVLVHGGAGSIPVDRIPLKLKGMKEAVRAGYRALVNGVGTQSLNAVQEAVMVMEDDEAFNAGKGSKLNIFGHVEMDASIMDGDGLKAGAVACVGGIRHPVVAARVVMDNTSHVLVVGKGAERLADKHKVETVEEEWLVTDYSRQLLEEYLEQHNLTHLQDEQDMWDSNPLLGWQGGMGTCGAVAIDESRGLAAATSTGGITGKLPGRVGDSPLLGQGVFADSESVAVSSTGTGETFMRVGVARRIGSLVDQGWGAQEAAEEALAYMRSRVGGEGGVIVVDKFGEVGIHWNSEMMAWAYGREGKLHFGIYPGEDFVEDL